MAWDDTKNTGDTITASDYNDGVTDQKGHKSRHQDGGSDEISVAGLSGTLADAQTPTSHASSHEDGGGDELDGTMGFQYAMLNEAPGTDHTGSGVIINDTAGESTAIGDVLYMKSDGKWWKADADAASTMPGAGLAMEAVSADAACNILLYGFFRDDTWNYTTTGALLYVDTTPGSPTATAPSGTGDQVQVVGVVITADIVLFNPSYVLVEVA